MPKTRGFSLSAREAATRARREQCDARERDRANGIRPDRPEVFVIRDPVDPHSFLFELRRFGGVVAYRGVTRFATAKAARAAGEVVRAHVEGRPSQVSPSTRTAIIANPQDAPTIGSATSA